MDNILLSVTCGKFQLNLNPNWVCNTSPADCLCSCILSTTVTGQWSQFMINDMTEHFNKHDPRLNALWPTGMNSPSWIDNYFGWEAFLTLRWHGMVSLKASYLNLIHVDRQNVIHLMSKSVSVAHWLNKRIIRFSRVLGVTKRIPNLLKHLPFL